MITQKREIIPERLQTIQQLLFPLCFVFPQLLNLVMFYLGFAFEENTVRSTVFLLGSVIFAVACGLVFLKNVRISALSLFTWSLLGMAFLFFCVSFLRALITYGTHSAIIGYAEEFIVFSIPSFLMGIYFALKKKKDSFFSALEFVSIIAIPAAFTYANGTFFDCLPWEWGNSAYLGILNYMTLAYSFMPFLLAHIIGFIEKKPLKILFLNRPIRHPQLLRIFFFIVYWGAIIASVTRGAYICVIAFCVLLIISKLIRREKTLKPAFFISLLIVATLSFNLFVYAPPGLYRINSMNIFLDGLTQGKLITAPGEDPSVSNRVEELVQSDGSQQVTNRDPAPNDPSPADPSPANPGSSQGTDIAEENLQIHDRGTLFKLAIGEFLKSPLFGMGLGGYAVKYGQYPHNGILELLCEGGIVGTVPILILILGAIFCMMRQKDHYTHYLLIFFLTYAVRVMISGSIWTCSPLLAALGYGLSLSGHKEVLPTNSSNISSQHCYREAS